MKEIQGINAVIAATFDDHGAYDFDSFKNLINHLIKIGTNGITTFGIATEFYKLSEEEKLEMVRILTALTKSSSTYAVASVTDHSTELAVKRAKLYAKMGVDALMLLPPFFLNPSIEQIKAHMKAVLEAVDIPVLVQYAPGETKKIIPAEEMATIEHTYPHAIFKLEPNPPMDYVRQMLQLAPKAKIMIGYAGLYMLDVMAAGGVGTMPGCSFAEIYLAIQQRWRAGDHEGALALHSQLMKYVRIWMSHPEYIINAEKVILKQRSIIKSDYCRAPYWKLDKEDYARIDAFLTEFKDYLS